MAGGGKAAGLPAPKDLLSAFLLGEEPLEPFLQWVVSDYKGSERLLHSVLQAMSANKTSLRSHIAKVKDYGCPPRFVPICWQSRVLDHFLAATGPL